MCSCDYHTIVQPTGVDYSQMPAYTAQTTSYSAELGTDIEMGVFPAAAGSTSAGPRAAPRLSQNRLEGEKRFIHVAT